VFVHGGDTSRKASVKLVEGKKQVVERLDVGWNNVFNIIAQHPISIAS